MIVATYALLSDSPRPTEGEAREAISGNLCRCTGYAKIVTAILSAASRAPAGRDCAPAGRVALSLTGSNPTAIRSSPRRSIDDALAIRAPSRASCWRAART